MPNDRYGTHNTTDGRLTAEEGKRAARLTAAGYWWIHFLVKWKRQKSTSSSLVRVQRKLISLPHFECVFFPNTLQLKSNHHANVKYEYSYATRIHIWDKERTSMSPPFHVNRLLPIIKLKGENVRYIERLIFWYFNFEAN